ncbi:MAG: YcaO-like family protein [Corynebacterium sp.]|nr:YcaO-like family protein [Corynebacterium sp.]
MKVVTVWSKLGHVTMIRDHCGDIYIPKDKTLVPESVHLHVPVSDPPNIGDLPVVDDFSVFIDTGYEDLISLSEKIMDLAQSSEHEDLLIVTASDRDERKGELSQAALEHFQRVRLLEVSLPVSCLGPVFTKSGVSYEDLRLRRMTNFPNTRVYEIYSTHLTVSSLDQLIPHVLQAFLTRNCVKFSADETGFEYITVEYDFAADEFYTSELIPFHLVGESDLAPAPFNFADIQSQNSRHGIVKKLRRIKNHDSLPNSLITVQSDVADLRFATDWANNTVCQGSTFSDVRKAELSALGEAYERYCVNIIDTERLIKGSAKTLGNLGLDVVNPGDFVAFDAEQSQIKRGRFEVFDDDTETTWIDARDYEGKAVLVPVSMVYVNHRYLKRIGDFPIPPVNSVAYAGISAGHTWAFACVNALQEIMERHATMCWWHNPPKDLGTVLPETGVFPGLIKEFEDRGNAVSIVGIKNRFELPIYAATLYNSDARIVNTGFACRLTNEEAILKALTEACTLQAGSFDLLRPDGELFKAIEREELWEGAARPWREDRQYLDYYSADFAEMNDLMLQQQVYLDPRLLERVSPWIFPEEKTGFLYPDTELDSYEAEYEFYIKKLTDLGLRPVFVDVTTPDVRALGIFVVRAIVPGLVPNFAVADLHLGKGTLQFEPVVLGQATNPTAFEDLNINPLPHC